MHGLKLSLVLFFAVVLGITGLCVLSLNHQVKSDEKLPPPPLDYNVAEGFRLQNPKTGVDSVSFESCGIQKKRMGSFALGAFNVLCIKGLVLNLPLDAEDSGAESEERKVKSEGAGNELLAGLLPKSMREKSWLASKRFSGIKVDGLKVNRVTSRSEVVPVFDAERMKNHGKTLVLTNCRVFADDGSTNLVSRATLRLKPVPVLAWDGGELRLDDLLK